MALVVQDDLGSLDANGYITVAFFKSYHDARGNSYSGKTDQQIEYAIIKATDYVDTRFAFRGTKLGLGIRATGTLTATSNFADGDTITINGRTYMMQAALAGDVDHVMIGGSLADSLSNLEKVLNGTGRFGIEYTADTEASDVVSATHDATHLYVTSLGGGSSGNVIATTETAANASWAGTTLTGGDSQKTEFPRMAGSEIIMPWFDINFLTPMSDVNLLTGTFVALVGPDGNDIIGIPTALKRATAEYSLRALAAGLFVDAPAPSAGPMPGRLIDSYTVKIDVIEESTKYSPPQSGAFVMPAYPAADLLLARAGLIEAGRTLVR